MSDRHNDEKVKIHKLPLIIKKKSLQSGSNSKYGIFYHCMSSSSEKLIKEDVIYKASGDDFLRGKYPNLLILNKLNVAKNTSRTTAIYDGPNSSSINLTSDAVVRTIGQENYDQVFSALCSVISQELKVKGILSLLSSNKIVTEEIKYNTIETQTYESSYIELIRDKQRRTRRTKLKAVKPYIVQDHVKTSPKRVIIHPCGQILNTTPNIKLEFDEENNSSICMDSKVEIENNITEPDVCDTNSNIKTEAYYVQDTVSSKEKSETCDTDLFSDFKFGDDDSNISDVGSIGNLSVGSILNLTEIENGAEKLLHGIDKHTEEIQSEIRSTITTIDGSTITIRGNPDPFHLTTPDILRDLFPEEKKKIMLYQAYIDWKYCLERDDDDNLPIHMAVLNNDVSLLKRQCLVLKSRNESVDITASGNLTALQMAISQDYPDCTSLLLTHGADMFLIDDESRNALHVAAEKGSKHVEVILTHCRNNARELLNDNEELWKPELESKSDTKLAQYLITKVCTMCDNQGYTPLMLASKIGNFAAVELLAKASTSTINMAMPNCGNTALYLAVGAACIEATKRGDKSKAPEDYEKTIGILIEHGADPSVDNNSGSNVNILLTEFNIINLSMFIATKIASMKHFHGGTARNCDSYMLVKNDQGAINIKDINKHKYTKQLKIKTINKPIKESPHVVVDKTVDTVKENSKANSNNISKVVTKHVDNDLENNSGSIETDKKPVVLKNLSVITKIVSFGKSNEKPILVKGILPTQEIGKVTNKGLMSQITVKLSPNKTVAQRCVPTNVKANTVAPKYLKILPKSELEVSKSDVTVKKSPIIFKKAAVKRHLTKNDYLEATSSKVFKH